MAAAWLPFTTSGADGGQRQPARRGWPSARGAGSNARALARLAPAPSGPQAVGLRAGVEAQPAGGAVLEVQDARARGRCAGWIARPRLDAVARAGVDAAAAALAVFGDQDGPGPARLGGDRCAHATPSAACRATNPSRTRARCGGIDANGVLPLAHQRLVGRRRRGIAVEDAGVRARARTPARAPSRRGGRRDRGRGRRPSASPPCGPSAASRARRRSRRATARSRTRSRGSGSPPRSRRPGPPCRPGVPWATKPRAVGEHVRAAG